jgi:hypothetical protein
MTIGDTTAPVTRGSRGWAYAPILVNSGMGIFTFR